MNNSEEHKNEAPGQNKEFKIYVNGREKIFIGKEITFREVVGLAYESPVFNDQIIYTVTYSKGVDKKPKGSMVDGGDPVHVKEEMIFNVTRTDKS
jgi:hypothetical protein